ncbi:MAG: hypothetical protein JW927_01630, partial [Deltaproteobacteria bacterium]|nr:hypothetical protein [Deltaproteobacteria bacterium]
MNKIKYLFIASFLMLISVSPVMAFPTYSLTQVVYNSTDNEVLLNLGSLNDIDMSATNLQLAPVGTVNLDQFTTIDSWSNLSIAFFGSRQESPRQYWFASTSDTAYPVSTAGFLNFRSVSTAMYDYSGDNNVFVGPALLTGRTTYATGMNINNTAPGAYGGLIPAAYIQYGEVNLGKLYTDGYVDMYLYHYASQVLDKGPDTSTDYTAILRFNIDGSTLLNPIIDRAPTVANPINDIAVDEDSVNVTIDLTNVFTDTDNDDALITKAVNSNSNPSLVTANISGNTLTLVFLPEQSGSANIVIRATSNGKTVDEGFTVTALPVDDPPVVANPISDISVDEDSVNVTISLASVFTDIDNDDALITKAVNSNSNQGLVNATIS